MSAGLMTGTSAIPTAPASDARSWWQIKQRLTPWLFLSPYFILTCVFFIYPVFYALVLAFFQTNGVASRKFIGLNNFTTILADRDFWTAMKNTTVFAIFSTCLQLPISLGLAMLLNRRGSRLKGIFRLAIFSPHLVGQVFVGVMFTMFFTPKYGLFNQFLQMLLGWVQGPHAESFLEYRWLGNENLVMPAIIIATMWMYVGFNMIYFLAALQNVDQSLIEAARIDGANSWQQFLNVTLPAIKPVATFVVVMSTIGSYNLFELPYTLLQGFGPNNSGMTVVGYMYSNGFSGGDIGYGAAVGWILTLVILSINLVQLKLSGTGKE